MTVSREINWFTVNQVYLLCKSELMKILLLAAFLFLQIHGFSQLPAESYAVDSASVEHAGVPKGEILKLSFDNSKIFPGTSRDYWIYIPAQYKADHPACVYVNQDGIQWNAPTVFDNLIFRKEMPVTIGIFITPGVVKSSDPNSALNRFNRSLEYDGLGKHMFGFYWKRFYPRLKNIKAVMAPCPWSARRSTARDVGAAAHADVGYVAA